MRQKLEKICNMHEEMKRKQLQYMNEIAYLKKNLEYYEKKTTNP